MRLKDRVAIVTGAGSGIGFATTKRFLEEGARVVAGYLKPDRLDRLRELGSAVIPIRSDVSVQEDVDRLVAAALKLGRLDIVVNNAGIMDRFLPVDEVTDDDWSNVLAVNLTGPMRLCRSALRPMLAAKRGVIVNVSSVGGLVGGRAGAAYTASKHGLIGLTRNLAAHYGTEGIRCVAVAPGAVNTGIPLGGQPSQRGYETLKKTLPLITRVADPDELAQLITFLASDEASAINGAVLTADAGWTAY